MKKSLKVLLLALCLLMVTACSGGGEKTTSTEKPTTSTSETTGTSTGEKMEITFGSTEQDTMAPGFANKWAIEEISKQTDGRIAINYHPLSTLGNDADLIQQVMQGTIPMAGFSVGAFSQYTPLFESIQMPFLISSYEEEREALNSDEMKALIAKVEEEFDVKVLAFLENGMRHFAMAGKPINSIEDIKNEKIRVAPAVIIQDAMTLIGANPMAITYGEVTTALQNKTIDGEEINITSAGSQKHYDVIKYISEIGFYPYPGVYIMNGNYFRSLSEEDQKIITEVYAQAQDKCLTEYIMETEDTFRKECEDNGVTFNTIEDAQPFKDAVAPLYQQYSEKDPLIKAFIDKFNQ